MFVERKPSLLAGMAMPKRNTFGFLLRSIAFLVPFSLTACAGSGAPSCVLVQYADVPVTFSGGLPIVEVTVAGHKLHMLVNTGAENSSITAEAAKTIPSSFLYGSMMEYRGANGTVIADARGVDSFQLGGITVRGKAFYVMALYGSRDIDGEIGEDVLRNYNIGLDFPHHQLILYQRGGCSDAFPWSGKFSSVGFDATEYAPEITFYIDAKPFKAILASGSSNISINAQSLKNSDVTPNLIGRTRKTIGIGDLAGRATLERFDTEVIGGEEFNAPWISVAHRPNLGGAGASIGETYLRHHQVYIDNDNDTLWLGTTVPAT